MEKYYARIVPNDPASDGPSRSNGTQVMIGDNALAGVTRIELVAEVDNLWRARIDCMVQPTDLMAVATIHEPNAWQKFRRWLKGA